VLELEAVLGSTASNSSVCYDPSGTHIAFAAGCVVVLFDPKKNKQTAFLSTKSAKKIVSIAFSKDGKYLAAGEVCAAVLRVALIAVSLARSAATTPA
jgi:WD40 repeat protein